jgi:hypothetical protein
VLSVGVSGCEELQDCSDSASTTRTACEHVRLPPVLLARMSRADDARSCCKAVAQPDLDQVDAASFRQSFQLAQAAIGESDRRARQELPGRP